VSKLNNQTPAKAAWGMPNPWKGLQVYLLKSVQVNRKASTERREPQCRPAYSRCSLSPKNENCATAADLVLRTLAC
jgi:hypothetical protein